MKLLYCYGFGMSMTSIAISSVNLYEMFLDSKRPTLPTREIRLQVAAFCITKGLIYGSFFPVALVAIYYRSLLYFTTKNPEWMRPLVEPRWWAHSNPKHVAKYGFIPQYPSWINDLKGLVKTPWTRIKGTIDAKKRGALVLSKQKKKSSDTKFEFSPCFVLFLRVHRLPYGIRRENGKLFFSSENETNRVLDLFLCCFGGFLSCCVSVSASKLRFPSGFVLFHGALASRSSSPSLFPLSETVFMASLHAWVTPPWLLASSFPATQSKKPR